MKRILTILAITGIGFTSCQKDAEAPKAVPVQTSTKTTSSVTTPNQGVAPNDTTKGYLRVQLEKDTINTDNILIEFNPASSAAYVTNEDARTFAGFGQESLSSLSSDNIPLAINSLPLVSSGTTVKLAVSAKSTGVYKLNLLAISTIPATIDIWLKDKYEKDSLDFRQYPSYAFNITTTDTATYGSNRFSVVLRQH
jgi:hypothetical protein